ncbi:MAG: UDP-glucose/GDP-mannose dehydrogenase family protein [Acidobacteria bacterium]|nr:UDP-glucose/GDP-mannose dehydrogenase family protein [Acidobacteriota bacterium]
MRSSAARVSIVGTGYVGLVTGACFASRGHVVTCVDRDLRKVDAIREGRAPFYEPGLEALLAAAGDRLRATTDLARAVAETDITFIAVGTPFDGEHIDLRQVAAAAKEIGAALASKPSFHVVVVKSTVVPGTTDDVVMPVLERASRKRAGVDFGVAMNPEFLRQGEALGDFLHPDRLVIGAADERTGSAVAALYAPFDPCPVLRTSTRTAEMIKYAANALLATLISFSNEIGNLCGAIGNVDAVDVMRGVHLDRRLTPLGAPAGPEVLRYLAAGCGFGGSCFPKDVKALVAHGHDAGVSMSLLESVLAVNRQQPLRVLALLDKHFETLAGVEIAVLGLAFKPGTDDMRESPAIPLIAALLDRGARVTGYDPAAVETAHAIFGERIELAASVEQAVATAAAAVVMTSWPELASLPGLVNAREPQPVVVDGRRVFQRHEFARYEGIGLDYGRPPVVAAAAAHA